MQAPPEIAALLGELDANARDARTLVEGLSEEDGRWRPAPGAWSVAECLDHLAVANRVYLEAMRAPAERARAAGRLRRAPALPGFIGRLCPLARTAGQVANEAKGPRQDPAPGITRPVRRLQRLHRFAGTRPRLPPRLRPRRSYGRALPEPVRQRDSLQPRHWPARNHRPRTASPVAGEAGHSEEKVTGAKVPRCQGAKVPGARARADASETCEHGPTSAMVSAIILAGGRSSRMGTPKALLPFDGEPLIVHLVRRLAPMFGEVIVVAAPDQVPPALPATLVRDEVAYQGPVGGITLRTSRRGRRVRVRHVVRLRIPPQGRRFALVVAEGRRRRGGAALGRTRGAAARGFRRTNPAAARGAESPAASCGPRPCWTRCARARWTRRRFAPSTLRG